eukprot:TRINITY_DN1852_c0_g1_i1.p1 TRINITY_DN1852_c0_g1~~TRINITY_DN1852_c0_g1_i1.p1  ORF type:complete len:117 (-),score=6.28 TRINITY_DN1852_c0_g1_i1:546-896(-)
MHMGQILTPATKNKRVVKAAKLLKKLKHPKDPQIIWFFSDEKKFCQNPVHNRQYHRWIASCPKDIPKVMKTKFPAIVMIFGVVSSEGDVMPLHIFESGLRVNTDIYLDLMDKVVMS